MNISTCRSVPAVQLHDLRRLPPEEPVRGLAAVNYVTSIELDRGAKASLSCSIAVPAADVDAHEPDGINKAISLINRLVSGGTHSPMPCVDSIRLVFSSILPQRKATGGYIDQSGPWDAHLSLAELCCSLSAASATPIAEGWISFSVNQEHLALLSVSFDEKGDLECARFDEIDDAFLRMFEEPKSVLIRR